MKKDYICKNCNSEFSRDNCGKNPTYCCLNCYKEYRTKNKLDYQQYKKDYGKKYYKINKKDISKKSKEYRKRTREIWKEKWKLRGKTLGTRYGVYKSTAKRRGIDFNITKEDFKKLWNKPCYYCNQEIIGIGVDRVDNNIGYEVNNIVPCCSWCNKMKLNKTKKEFFNHCKKIINFNKL